MSIKSVLPLIILAIAAPANAADMPRETPQVFKSLLDCRALTDGTARLACYDAQVTALASAEEKQDVVVVDRKQIRQARRSLFGLALPKIDLFGGEDKEDQEGFEEIETTIKSAARTSEGRWSFVLEDGAKWVQAETKTLPRDPRAGFKIKIRRAALGSFVANIEGQNGTRVRRMN